MGLLIGTKVLAEKRSAINGKISVVKSLALGTYIQVENLTQSGGVVYDVWKSTLKKVKSQKLKVKSCLILGLGGGSAAKLVRKFWPASPNRGEPEAKITGVDIDPVMVGMGKKYLGLGEQGIDIVIEDAGKFLKRQVTSKKKYELILVDLYVGDKVPPKFETENYLHLVRSILKRSGVSVFNRLYYGEKRKDAGKFGEKLEKAFPRVERFFPEANIMFICSS